MGSPWASARRDVPTPIEPPPSPQAPAVSRFAPSNEGALPPPLSRVAGQSAGPPDSVGGTRFAVAASPTGGGRLTFPAAIGGVSSPTGLGAGSAVGGSQSKGSGASFSQPSGGYQVLPRYPESARRKGIQGITEIKIHVLSDGSVAEVVVARSAGHPELDEAALEAVKRWRFEPARRGAEPVAIWALIPIRFRIE